MRPICNLRHISSGGGTSATLTLVGIAEYGSASGSDKVIIHFDAGAPSGDMFYIAFNRATGINADTKHYKDLVTIVTQERITKSHATKSWLKAALGVGGAYDIPFTSADGYPAKYTVTVNSIDTGSVPARATVTFYTGVQLPAAP